MTEDSVFAYYDYKQYISSQIESNPAKWGLISKLAVAAGCQRSYLSRALSSAVHLTPDHVFGLSEYWKLTESETDFFLLLLEKDRVSTLALRERIASKIKKLKSEHDNLANRVKRPKVDMGEKEICYYSVWHFSAIHIIVSIPGYQTAKAIAERLQLDVRLVEDTLRALEEFGLIRHERNRWVFNSSEIHIPKVSALASLHHANWRHRAIQDSQKRLDESIHFTVVQSIDKKAWTQIREKMLALIDQATEIARPSREEKLICLACDFFEV